MQRRPRPARRDIVLHPLSSSEWRVSDGRVPVADLRGLLGFVQRSGNLFEVVRMGQPFVRSYCSTLEEAAQQFVRPHTFLEELPKSLPDVDGDADDPDLLGIEQPAAEEIAAEEPRAVAAEAVTT